MDWFLAISSFALGMTTCNLLWIWRNWEREQEMGDQLVRKLQSKIDKQREEIARLTRQVLVLRKENAKLLADLKWMRGEDKD